MQRQESTQTLLNKILFVIVAVLVGLTDIGTEWEHLRREGERGREREGGREKSVSVSEGGSERGRERGEGSCSGNLFELCHD